MSLTHPRAATHKTETEAPGAPPGARDEAQTLQRRRARTKKTKRTESETVLTPNTITHTRIYISTRTGPDLPPPLDSCVPVSTHLRVWLCTAGSVSVGCLLWVRLIRSSVLRPPLKNFFWHSTEISSCCFPFGLLIYGGTIVLPFSFSSYVYFIPFLPAPLSIVTEQRCRCNLFTAKKNSF